MYKIQIDNEQRKIIACTLAAVLSDEGYAQKLMTQGQIEKAHKLLNKMVEMRKAEQLHPKCTHILAIKE